MEIISERDIRCCDRIAGLYTGAFGYVSRLAQNLNLDFIWDVIAAIGTEFTRSLELGAVRSMGDLSSENFRYFGMNPTEEKTKALGVLLIHGASSNQSVFVPLGISMSAQKLETPVYSVNVPSMGTCCHYEREIQEDEFAAVRTRIADIHKLGIERIVIVGHSRGAEISRRIAGENDKIAKVITLANPSRSIDGRFYDLVAWHDAICTHRSQLPERQQATFMTGHLGILFSHQVHLRVIEQIRSCD